MSIKEIIHNLKFNGKKRLSHHLGRIASLVFSQTGIAVDLVTSVPASRVKLGKRGYDQSELIARALAKFLKVPYLSLLREKGRSPVQKELGFSERFINVIGRYSIKNRRAGALLKGKRILLVDDILTTGATINECARILLEGGIVEVFSLTIARAGIKKLENF